MRSSAYFFLFIAVLGWNSCRQAKPVVVRKPPVNPSRSVATTKPVAQKPSTVKTAPPKPVVPVLENPDETLEFDEVTDLTSPPPKREFRAVWIATVENMDWPSRKGLPVADQQREIVEMFDLAAANGVKCGNISDTVSSRCFLCKRYGALVGVANGSAGISASAFL